jgi:hypothetical protein
MAIYSLALRSTVTTINAASWAVVSPATNEAAIMEWRWVNGAATASVFGFARAGNSGTLSAGTAFLAEDEGRPTGLTQAGVAFTVAPTTPANYFRKASVAAVIGCGIVYTFPRGIVLAAGTVPVVCWNLTANSAVVDIDCVVDE